MFICNRILGKIWFFDGTKLSLIAWDFDKIYKLIEAKFSLLSDFFINWYWNYSDTAWMSKIISIRHSTTFEIEEKLIEEVGYKKVLQYICAFNIDDYLLIESWDNKSEIYWIVGDNYPTKRIKSKEELIRLWFMYDMTYQDDIKLHICYAQFSLARWNYSKSNYISTDGIGVDHNNSISIEKALSECIERASWSYYHLAEIVGINKISRENAKIICDYWEKLPDESKGNYLYPLYGDQNIFLPENFLYYPCSKRFYYETNSSWMATHITLEKSIIGWLLELIERDAFIYSWLTKSKKIRRIEDKKLQSIIDFDILEIEGIKFSCFVLDSSISVFSVMWIMEKNDKNIISLWCDFLFEDSIIKSFQEWLNARHLFDSDLSSKSNNSIILDHIYYYLDPQNSSKLNRIKNASLYQEENNVWWVKNFKELISWFKKNNFYVWYYEFLNELNDVFGRRTVRVFAPSLIPIYFGPQLLPYILNHPKLKEKEINLDLHPLW